MPWSMSSYVLNKYSDLSPPFHLTADGVDMEMDSHRVTPGSIVSRRIFRGFPGTVSVQYLTCWDELEKTSWETKQDLEQYGNVVEHYWAGELKQVGGEKHEISSASCADGKNGRKCGQPARYICRQGTSSVATQDAAPTCTHLTSLARAFFSRQLAMDGNL